jgi:hypothetical protein
VLTEIAIHDPAGFAKVVETAKAKVAESLDRPFAAKSVRMAGASGFYSDFTFTNVFAFKARRYT